VTAQGQMSAGTKLRLGVAHDRAVIVDAAGDGAR
jgi:hypothetical protein